MLVLTGLVSGGWIGWHRYTHRPRPNVITIRVFDPDASALTKEPLVPRELQLVFSAPVARLESTPGKAPTGMHLTPVLPGKWEWRSDSVLIFKPTEDWPADTALRVTLDPLQLRAGIVLDRLEVEAHTAAFTARLLDAQFYQDPREPETKQVTATLEFSHRVEIAEVQHALSLETIGESKLFPAGAAARFSVAPGLQQRQFFVRSVPLALPEQEDFLRIALRAGVSTLQGGSKSKNAVEAKVRIPDVFSFFRIDRTETILVRNKAGEPEKVLLVHTTAAAKPEDVAKALEVYLLPTLNPAVDHPEPEAKGEEAKSDGTEEESSDSDSATEEEEGAAAATPTPAPDPSYPPEPVIDDWTPAQVDEATVKKSTKVALVPLPAASAQATIHSFRYQLNSDGRLYVRIRKGLVAPGGFKLKEDYANVLSVPIPEQELEFQNEGAVLALSGERKLAVKSRGLELLEYEIARVPADQINHLVSQTSGAFSDPEFRSEVFTKDNIARIAFERQPLARRNLFEAQYSAFDFGKHLPADAKETRFRQGLFLLRAQAIDPRTQKPIKDVKAQRFVLVTDLGLLVKSNTDGSREVFVAGLKAGLPLGGVTVDLLAKNGLVLATAQTGADGKASIPAMDKLTRDRQPVAFVARRGDDVAFLPYRPRDRGLDYSRFDVAGVQAKTGSELDAFVFTERGVYRPGDDVQVAVIVHQRDWSGSLEGVPVELVTSDPEGHKKRLRKFALPSSGFAEGKLETTPESATGPYEVQLYLLRDGKRSTLLGSADFSVKEFEPDRLKIALTLSKPATRGWVNPEGMKAAIVLQNLYGTPASELRIAGELALEPSGFEFDEYPGWKFYDPMLEGKKKGKIETVALGDQKTNDKGEAEFEFDLSRFSAATYALTAKAEGFEADSGRSVKAYQIRLVSPLAHVIGWKTDGSLDGILLGAERKIQFIALNPSLEPVPTRPLKVRLLERTQVSMLVKQDNGNYRYESSPREREISVETGQISTEGLPYVVPTKEPGSYAVELLDEAGKKVANVAFSVIGAGAASRTLDKDAELQIKLPRKEFRAGDTVEIGITAPYTGCGLITLERDRVYAHQWFRATQTSSLQKLTIPADFDGTGYVNVSFVRALDSKEIYASPLSFAVVRIVVNREKRRLPVTLQVPREVKPGEPLHIKFHTDRPGKIAIFAVDKGIHQVSAYELPDPVGHFFRAAALLVGTSQILDQLLPEFSLVRAMAATGGGDEKAPKTLNPFRRVTEKPVVFWSGVIDADKTEREVIYEVPEYFNGTLNVMAIACAPDAVGGAEKTALVRGSFILSPGVPTVAAPGDSFETTVTVANNIDGSGDAAAVHLELQASEHLELVGPAAVDLTVGEGKETRATFKVRVKEKLGSAELTFRATAPTGETGKSRATLSVRPATPLLTSVQSGNFTGASQEVPVARSLHPEFRQLEASVSALPLGLAAGLNTFLQGYPNGCTEQVVSAAFARLALTEVPYFALSRAEVVAQLEKVYAILRQRQNDKGAFGYWAVDRARGIDEISVYATHFLLEARTSGFAPPEDILKNAVGFLRTMVALDPHSLREARVLAHAIYLVTREGTVTTNYILNLRDWLNKNKGEKGWRNDLTAVYLAGSLALLQKKDEAEALIANWKPGQLEKSEWWDFCQPLSADSQAAAVLADRFPERLRSWTADDLQKIVRPIADNRFSTYSAAWAVVALKGYARVAKADVANLGISEIDAAKAVTPLTLPPGGALRRGVFSERATGLRFERKGAAPTANVGAFYQTVQTGFDRRPPAEAASAGIEVYREIVDAAGKAVTTAKLGGALTVRLRVRSASSASVTNVAILDLLPGGFEIADGSVTPGPGWKGMDNVDVREDRIVFFCTATPRVQEFLYKVKATSRGEFTLPPISAESMYDRAVMARGLAGRIVVTAP